MLLGNRRRFLDLALSKQARRPRRPQLERPPCDHVDANRFREARRFIEPRFGCAAVPLPTLLNAAGAFALKELLGGAEART